MDGEPDLKRSTYSFTVKQHNITKSRNAAPKGDLHFHVLDMNYSSSKEIVMEEGCSFRLIAQWGKLKNDPVPPALTPDEGTDQRGGGRLSDPENKTHCASEISQCTLLKTKRTSTA